jgi:hypothetical protein
MASAVHVLRLSCLVTTDHALAPVPDLPGLAPRSPDVTTHVIGISQDGELYLYGDSPSAPGPIVPAIVAMRILDVVVVTRGVEGSRYGQRDYLDVRLLTDVPSVQYILRLPTQNGQWSYRSLLGALMTLDLAATALKIEPRRGKVATFLQVSLDPEGINRVNAPAIGPDRDDLEVAVDRCRALLGLEPQFPDLAPANP